MTKIWFGLQIWNVHSKPWYKSENSEIFPISRFFPDFFPISPIFDFTGISGKKYRGNRMHYGKKWNYFMEISLSYLAQTEWKNHFSNSSYLIFAKTPVFGPNPPFWWRNMMDFKHGKFHYTIPTLTKVMEGEGTMCPPPPGYTISKIAR